MAISSCLVDTNILLRAAKRSDPQHALVEAALAKLALDGANLYYTHQNIAELWNAMTRPLTRNGFGLSVEEAEREVLVIEAGMTCYRITTRPIASGESSLLNTGSLAFKSMTLAWWRRCKCMV